MTIRTEQSGKQQLFLYCFKVIGDTCPFDDEQTQNNMKFRGI